MHLHAYENMYTQKFKVYIEKERYGWLDNSQMGKKRKNIFAKLELWIVSLSFLSKICEFFQIGTEAFPFQHQAVITLHGHLRSPELPVYGAKTLAVREGTLDLHGRLKALWYKLASLLLSLDSLYFFLTPPLSLESYTQKWVSQPSLCLPSRLSPYPSDSYGCR